MKKKMLLFLLISVLFVAAFPISASADMGPKPSVVVDFDGLAGQTYYVTLLANIESTGPYYTVRYSEYSFYNEGDPDYSIFQKFVEYQDADGYYFLQYFEDCSKTQRFEWTYYPPSVFKVLIYFPESDSFAVSEKSYEKYAFDSYYKVKVNGAELSSALTQGEEFTFTVVQSYDTTGEVLALLCRVVLTVAVEIFIAFSFGFKHKKQLIFIVAVNLATQIALNLVINLAYLNLGRLMLIFVYLLIEPPVFIVEAILFTIFLRKLSDKPIKRWTPIVYALAANAASFAVGLILSLMIPAIF